jgi:tRNA A37 threonylcarbamoyltransferase TsaD
MRGDSPRQARGYAAKHAAEPFEFERQMKKSKALNISYSGFYVAMLVLQNKQDQK